MFFGVDWYIWCVDMFVILCSGILVDWYIATSVSWNAGYVGISVLICRICLYFCILVCWQLSISVYWYIGGLDVGCICIMAHWCVGMYCCIGMLGSLVFLYVGIFGV